MSYYFSNDKTLKSVIKEKKVFINNLPFSFYTDNGVFSKNGLDFGTRTLLESIDNISGDVLDLGCGYGPIGIYLTKKYNANVDMIDINERCIDLVIKNAKLNEVKVNTFVKDSYKKITKKYDYIITNPPIRVGKEILYNLLEESKNYLKTDGKMYIVVNKNQGAKSLKTFLEQFYKVDVINKNKGFYIIKMEKY